MTLDQLVSIKRKMYTVITYNIKIVNFSREINEINTRTIEKKNRRLYSDLKIHSII